ncbi:MAG: flavin reductase family protein, partial [Lachnospiraceae bacterium]
MDKKAFQKLSYGLYLISTKAGDHTAGCVVNTFAQVTSDPAQVTIAINKDNHTTSLIQESGYFTCVALSQSATMELIGTFGFHSSKDYDKFKDFKTATDANGIPYVCEQASARFSCKVSSQMDVGSHVIFLGEVQDAEILDIAVPMT